MGLGVHQNGPGIICEASLEDLPALLALEKQGFPRDTFSEEEFRHLLTEAHATTPVIAYDGAVRGAAALPRAACVLALSLWRVCRFCLHADLSLLPRPWESATPRGRSSSGLGWLPG